MRMPIRVEVEEIRLTLLEGVKRPDEHVGVGAAMVGQRLAVRGDERPGQGRTRLDQQSPGFCPAERTAIATGPRRMTAGQRRGRGRAASARISSAGAPSTRSPLRHCRRTVAQPCSSTGAATGSTIDRDAHRASQPAGHAQLQAEHRRPRTVR